MSDGKLGVGAIIGIIALVLVLFIGGIALFIGSTYNGLVRMDVGIKTAWSQVENQLQRRNDLIPNLVQTVKGFATQEKTVFTNIADARARLAGAGNRQDQIKAANDLSGALSRLLVVVENYPQLKSDQNFRQLMDELSGTENRIAVERMRYNQVVQAYNSAIRTFPRNIVAGMFNFKEAPLFKAAEGAKEAPKVDFETPAK